jgi:outer membrane protein assembly factor BamB
MHRSHFTVLLTSLIVCGFGASSPVTAQPDVTPDADIKHSGVVPQLDVKSQPKTIWQFAHKNVALGDLVVADDAVFVATDDGRIHALRSADGLKLWESGTFINESVTGIAVSSGESAEYVIATSGGGIVAFNQKNGQVVWKIITDQGLASPLIVGKSIFAGGYDGKVYSFKLVTGEILWKHDFLQDAPPDPPGFDGERARFGDKPARPRALSSDGNLVFLTVFDQCRVLAINADTGQRVWDAQTQGWMYGRPAVGRDRIFVGSQDKNLYAVDIGSGNISWIVETKSRVEAPAAVNDRFAFFGSCDANLYCLDRVTGHLVWKQATDKYEKYGGPIYAQPIVGEDAVYLATMEGQIYKFQMENGKILWKFRPSEDSQIVKSCTDGKRIYVTTRENFDDKGTNVLYAIGQE